MYPFQLPQLTLYKIEIVSPVLGLLDDAFFRYIADIGVTGPDKGKGDIYFVVGPDYKGNIPERYFFLARKPTVTGY